MREDNCVHVFQGDYEVARELRDRFGLTIGPFVEAVRQGIAEKRMTTSDDVPWAGGFYMYTRATRVFRVETRAEAGWHRGNYRRLEVAFDPERSVAVAVSTGDERTGRPGPDPQSKNIKGPATIDAVEGNLYEERSVDFWILLIHDSDDGWWAEVSRPLELDEDGYVCSWDVRILLGDLMDDGEPARRRGDGPIEPAASIDVPVVRKSA